MSIILNPTFTPWTMDPPTKKPKRSKSLRRHELGKAARGGAHGETAPKPRCFSRISGDFMGKFREWHEKWHEKWDLMMDFSGILSWHFMMDFHGIFHGIWWKMAWKLLKNGIWLGLDGIFHGIWMGFEWHFNGILWWIWVGSCHGIWSVFRNCNLNWKNL